MRKNGNINKESIQAMKEYSKKRIESNIKLHKIFLTILIIFDICLFSFLIIFKKKITDIRLNSTIYSQKLTKTNNQAKSLIQQKRKKMVNILSKRENGRSLFSFLFKKHEEVAMVKNFISTMFKEKGENASPDKINIKMIYQGYSDGFDSESLFDNIEHYENIVLLFMSEGQLIGFFYKKPIYLDEEGKYNSNDDNCFAFTFEDKNMYKYIGNKNCIKVSDGKLIIGNDDIIIDEHFPMKGGDIYFPFKSFDASTIDKNFFTENKIPINTIEIFSFQLF